MTSSPATVEALGHAREVQASAIRLRFSKRIHTRSVHEGKDMSKSIAVLSTGAIGSSIAADLTEAGHDVSLIDQWPEHVAAVRARGVKVTMSDREIQVPVRAFHLCDLASMKREFDIVFLTAKSQETRWMGPMITISYAV